MKKCLCVVLLGLMSLVTIAGPDEMAKRTATNWCNWPAIHKSNIEKAKNSKFEIIFLGDSHTASWINLGEFAFNECFAGYNILNLGITGDKTQNVLYRIKNGELTNQQDAKVVMLLIGANNLFATRETPDTPEATLEGVKAIIAEIKQQLPKAKIILVSNFPNNNHGDGNYRLVRDFNRLQKDYAATDKQIIYLDIFDKFLVDDKLNKDLFYEDQIHLRYGGYKAWGVSAKPLLDSNK